MGGGHLLIERTKLTKELVIIKGLLIILLIRLIRLFDFFFLSLKIV